MLASACRVSNRLTHLVFCYYLFSFSDLSPSGSSLSCPYCLPSLLSISFSCVLFGFPGFLPPLAVSDAFSCAFFFVVGSFSCHPILHFFLPLFRSSFSFPSLSLLLLCSFSAIGRFAVPSVFLAVCDWFWLACSFISHALFVYSSCLRCLLCFRFAMLLGRRSSAYFVFASAVSLPLLCSSLSLCAVSPFLLVQFYGCRVVFFFFCFLSFLLVPSVEISFASPAHFPLRLRQVASMFLFFS